MSDFLAAREAAAVERSEKALQVADIVKVVEKAQAVEDTRALRVDALNHAVTLGAPGEDADATLERANAYISWLLGTTPASSDPTD